MIKDAARVFFRSKLLIGITEFLQKVGVCERYIKVILQKNKEILLVFSLLSYIIEERKGCWIWHRQ